MNRLPSPTQKATPAGPRRKQGRLWLSFLLGLLGFGGLTLAGLALCWPDAPALAATGLPAWLAAGSLALCGVMLVRGSQGLRDAALSPEEHAPVHLSHSRACCLVATLFFSPVAASLLVHALSLVVRG